jgi:hypothetical protein
MENTISENDALRETLIAIFEEVKETVWKAEGRSRAGLMLGLQDIEASGQGFIGGYFPMGSNIIIINIAPIRRILQNAQRELLHPYVFHVLLHEYIHACGFCDENIVRQKTYEISKIQFGEDHLITQFSTNIQKFLPQLLSPTQAWACPDGMHAIELVPGFDSSNIAPYIS